MDNKQLKLLADTAALAGELMLTSGAETYRAENTMAHILRKGTNARITTLALITSIMITIEEEDSAPITIARRISGGSTKLNRITRVNEISRDYCDDKISLEEAHIQLLNIPSREYNATWFNAATIGAATGFTMFFGGTWLEILATLLTSVVMAFLITMCKRFRVGGFVLNCITSVGLAFTCITLKNTFLPSINSDVVIIGSIMPLVPGVAITNAIRDTLQGDYISGSARILEAFVTAAAIAIGVGLGMLIYRLV